MDNGKLPPFYFTCVILQPFFLVCLISLLVACERVDSESIRLVDKFFELTQMKNVNNRQSGLLMTADFWPSMQDSMGHLNSDVDQGGNLSYLPYFVSASDQTQRNAYDVLLQELAVNREFQSNSNYRWIIDSFDLYNHPDGNKVTRIPWENSDVFKKNEMWGKFALNSSLFELPPIFEGIAEDKYKTKYDEYLLGFIMEEGDPFPSIGSSVTLGSYVIEAGQSHALSNAFYDLTESLIELRDHVNNSQVNTDIY